LIPFTKAHACGNDFLIVTEEAAAGAKLNQDWAELTRRLCARNTGIGADGIEFFAWDQSKPGRKAGRIRLHNADGSIAEISGNGTRCVAAWMAEAAGAKAGDTLEIETDAGLRICRVNAIHDANGYTVEITIGMGVPRFASRTVTIPGGVQVLGMEASTGNPHFVIVVDNADFTVDGQRWQSIGQQVCGHPDFPYQTNVEFVRVLSPSEIEIRIFERGVGPTASSGTGTSASAAAVIAQGLALSPLRVIAPGGAQTVEWNATDAELQLTGPAALIARGEAWEE
jgi:diaminopimelate epimerase